MVVSESMTDYFASAHTSSTVGDAMDKMLREGLAHLLIVDDRSQLVGSIEESVLIDAVFAAQLKRDPVTIHMRTDLDAVGPDDPIAAVLEKFRRLRVSEFPVTENGLNNGKLVGVLTRRQLIRALLKRSRSEIFARKHQPVRPEVAGIERC